MDAAKLESDDLPEALLAPAQEAAAALERLQRLAFDECGVPAERRPAEGMHLNWQSGAGAEVLAEQALRAARHLGAEAAVIRPFRVYCYHCETSECHHAVPATTGEVFAGYENTGRPRWQEFFNYLQAIEDRRVDGLFDESPRLLARLVGRKRLISEQFAAYGRASLTYRVLGQVVAGYLTVRRQRCALTVQLVETHDHTLHVQTITPDFVWEALTDATERRAAAFHRIFDAIREARHSVDALSQRWEGCADKAERQKLREKMAAVLRHLAGSMERKSRQQQRRTSHAEQRSREKRPVHKAREDLAAATVEQFYRDSFSQHIVVVGRGQRAHVFSEDGRHVTSLMLSGDELARRERRKRFVQLDLADVEGIRQKVLDDGDTPGAGESDAAATVNS